MNLCTEVTKQVDVFQINFCTNTSCRPLLAFEINAGQAYILYFSGPEPVTIFYTVYTL